MILNARLLSLKEILGAPLPPVEWDCEPIIPHQRRIVFFGEFGALKSWILLHLGLHLAAGVSWLGFQILQPRSVLYIDEEMAQEDLRRRVKQLADGMKHSLERAEFRAYSRVGVTFDQSGAHQLLACLRREEYTPSVIIVESLVRVLRGSENFSWDISTFWRNVEPILAAGSTLIVSHHMSKPNFEAPQPLRSRARGSGDIAGGSDVAWAVEIVKEGQISRLSCIKTRASATPKPIMVQVTGTDNSVTLSVVAGNNPSSKLSELHSQSHHFGNRERRP